MSTTEYTTIKISIENWKRLNAVKEQPGESFDDAVGRLFKERQ